MKPRRQAKRRPAEGGGRAAGVGRGSRAARALPWLLGLCSAVLQTAGATESGHLMWVAPIPWGLALMLVTDEALASATWWRAAGVSAFTGAVAALGLWGMAFYSLGVYLLAIFYVAMCWGAFGLVASWTLARGGRLALLSCGALWAFGESLRALGALSFPFFFGGMLADETWVAQLAALIGACGLSALVFWVGFAVAGLLARLLDVPRWGTAACWLPPGLVLAAVATAGRLRVSDSPVGGTPGEASVRVAAVQGSVPSWLYSIAKGSKPFKHIVEAQYETLYRRARALEPAPDVVVFPETAFDWHIPPTTEALRKLAPFGEPVVGSHTSLLVGASLTEDCGEPLGCRSLNGILVAEPDTMGRPVVRATLTKRRLVPFIEVGHKPADRWTVGVVGGKRVGVMVCFESMYPEAAAEAAMGGAEFLVIASDDSGMRYSPLSRVHAAQARFRAIESGLPLLRAGQAGPSYATDRYGRTLASLDAWAVGVLHAELPVTSSTTFFRRWGRSWLWVWGVVALLPASVGTWRARRQRLAADTRPGKR